MPRKTSTEDEGIVRFFVDVLINSAVIIVLFFIVQAFIAAPYQVVGSSMYETLYDGEYIVVSKLEYLMGEPERGDVVVFHPPLKDHRDEYYIKRIIGIPGDTVRLKAGKVSVNNFIIDEQYLKEGVVTCITGHLKSCENDDKEYVVPEGKYFVLGDNRHGSSDSRAWVQDGKPLSFVELEEIQGKTRVIVYPLPKIRLMEETDAFAQVSS